MAGKVNPIPEGAHTITPHLICKDAGKAVDWYKKAFGAEELFRIPGPDGKSICHAELKIGDSQLYLCEESPEMGCLSAATIGNSAVTVHLYVQDADKVFNQAAKAGAEVLMPLTDMFWGDRYGKLKDPFGHHWSVGTHIEDVAPAEIQKRMAEQFGAC